MWCYTTKWWRVDDIEIKIGMFVIVPYDFATASSMKESSKNLLALILDANDKTLEVQYWKLVWQPMKCFVLVPKCKVEAARTNVLIQSWNGICMSFLKTLLVFLRFYVNSTETTCFSYFGFTKLRNNVIFVGFNLCFN